MKRLSCAAVAALVLSTAGHAAELGQASWYVNPHHGGLIAAHKTLPMGSRVRVTNLDNGRSLVVVIVDRGPWGRGRVIDVSNVVAQQLGFYSAGLARVRLDRL